jgi:2-keto-4-pentenoate hydratase/2-oxohepta-3-ene-1,7-dioic acid hydratase in catechol pathway
VKRVLIALIAAGSLAGVWLSAQTQPRPAGAARTPFKVGTFERQGRPFVGVVVKDALVIDLAAADAAVQGKRVPPPADMKDLIARYDSGLSARIDEIVTAVNAAGTTRPSYAQPIASVKTLAPVLYPTTMLNAAVNYREHGAEVVRRDAARQGGAAAPASAPGDALPGTQSAPGIWVRKPGDTRWNPYMFLKASSAVIGEGEAIRIPEGRTQIDWECELGIVVGRTASRVSVEKASDYIFGYTLEQDISDRGGRGDTRHGSDWLVGKSHDTFAPLGPFIVPKEFVANVQKLPIKFTLNGQVMQDADTSLMIHDVKELMAYGSSILTLRAGDVIATGSPAGVGSARTPPIFLKAGDKTVCTYEGVGTLTNPVENAK